MSFPAGVIAAHQVLGEMAGEGEASARVVAPEDLPVTAVTGAGQQAGSLGRVRRADEGLDPLTLNDSGPLRVSQEVAVATVRVRADEGFAEGVLLFNPGQD